MAADPLPAAAGGGGRPIIGAQPWLTTLADLISVMLAFMVLTFAGIIASPRAAAPPPEAAMPAHGRDLPGLAPALPPPADASLEYLALMLNRTRQAEAPSSGIVVQRNGDGLVILIAAGRLFPTDDAALAPEMAGWLQRLTPSLPPQPGPVQVFGVGSAGGSEADRALALQRALAVASVISSGPAPRPTVAYGFPSSTAALSWLRLAATPAAARPAAAIVMDERGEPQ
jgi:hypothetical protein